MKWLERMQCWLGERPNVEAFLWFVVAVACIAILVWFLLAMAILPSSCTSSSDVISRSRVPLSFGAQ